MPNSLKSHIETLIEMTSEYAGKNLSAERAALTAAIESLSRQGGGSKVCETCNGHGMIGGPSFREPDEGGVPCPDCTRASEAGDSVDAARYRWMVKWIMTGESLPDDIANPLDSAMDDKDFAAFDAAIDKAIAAAPAPGGG